MSNVTETDYTIDHVKVPIVETWDSAANWTFSVQSFSLNYLADSATTGQLYAAVGRWIDAKRKEAPGLYIQSVYGQGDHLNVVYRVPKDGEDTPDPFAVVASDVPSANSAD